jgi:hypothetical protein
MRPPTASLSRLCAIGLTLYLLASPSQAPAQDTTKTSTATTTTTTITATLLKRLGEAVDGYRNGRPMWVVAAYAYPHEVLGAYADSGTAVAMARRPGFHAFGPFVALPDIPRAMTYAYAIQPCVHYDPTRWECGDTLIPLGVPSAQVESVSVVVYTTGGVPHRESFRGAEVDALFFTMSAIDKFVIPYYTLLYGAAYGAKVRRGSLRTLHGSAKP